MTMPTTELGSTPAMTRAGIARKIADLRSLHVSTDRDHDLTDQLDRLLQVDDAGRQISAPVRFTAEMETRGITIIEPAGAARRRPSAGSFLATPRSIPRAGRRAISMSRFRALRRSRASASRFS